MRVPIALCLCTCLAAAARTATADAAPGQGSLWLVQRTFFKAENNLASYSNYYVFNQDPAPYYDRDSLLPKDALQINSSEVNDCWIQLAGQVPHRVRWIIEIICRTNDVTLVPEADGVVFSAQSRLPGLDVSPGRHTVRLERCGATLSVRVDDGDEAMTLIAPDTHAPLRITVRRLPLIWLCSSELYGDATALPWFPSDLSTARPPAGSVKWREVYRQDFSNPKSLDDFTRGYTNGSVSWNENERCLAVVADPAASPSDVTLVSRLNLPGDVRVTLKARNIPPESHFFGLFISASGDPRSGGYFCEWNRNWMRRIKKLDIQRAINRVVEPDDRKQRWREYRVERIGARVAMFTDGVPVLDWEDPDPFNSPEQSMLAIYVWRMAMEFDDIVIERNAADPDAGMIAVPWRPGKPRSTERAVDTVIVRGGAHQPPENAQLHVPRALGIARRGDLIAVDWETLEYREYDVESCNSFEGKVEWKTVPGWDRVRGREGRIAFTAPVSTNGHCFYRLVVRPSQAP